MTKWQKAVRCLARNNADELSLVAPPFFAICVFGVYIKFQGKELMLIWWWGTIALMLLAGCWRACRSKGSFAPLTAPMVGAMVGFAVSQSPATIYAQVSSQPAPVLFHFTVAQWGMWMYGLPGLLVPVILRAAGVELASREKLAQRMYWVYWVIVVVAVAFNLLPVVQLLWFWHLF